MDLSKLSSPLSKGPIQSTPLNRGTLSSDIKKPNVEKAVPFSELLNDRMDGAGKGPDLSSQLAELKFSAHAKTRLESRGIELNPGDILRMQEAVQRAGAKGSRESLILSDKGAFIVSVKNNTVITAVDKASLKENVFTNIDSTIMI